MKKILLVLAIVFTMGFGVKAQFGNNDVFFKNWDDYERYTDLNEFDIAFPNGHGLTNDSSAPLGSGLLILTHWAVLML